MGERLWRTTAVLSAVLLWTHTLFSARLPERTTSVSGEFIIFSANSKHREATAKRAEEIKEDVLRLMDVRDEWKHPVIIQIREAQFYGDNPVSFRLTMHNALDNELKIQLDVSAAGSVNKDDMEREIVRALLMEMMYRKENYIAGNPYYLPPDWLVEAILASISTRKSSLDAPLFEALIKKGGAPDLQEFLDLKPTRMDSTSRTIYRAQALALLQAWLGTPSGRRDLTRYLAQISNGETPKATLLATFTAAGKSEQRLQRWWTLAIARSSAMDRTEAFSPDETEATLVKILDVKAKNDPKKPNSKPLTGPDALISLARQKDSRIIFQTMGADLLKLNVRAHPAYRPIVEQYIGIVKMLSKGKTAKVSEYISKVESERKVVIKRMDKISDYMNWYEASKMTQPSGQFDQILNHAGEYYRDRSGRDDAISRYLDEMENQGW